VADGNTGHKKVTNGLVALSSAAVLAVYGAGYARTQAAADRFSKEADERHPHIPRPHEEHADAPRALALNADPAPARAPAPATTPEPARETRPTVEPRPATPTPATVNEIAAAKVAPSAAPIAEPAASAAPLAPAEPTATAPAAPTAPPEPATTAAAQSPIPAPAPAPVAPAVVAAKFKDGTYTGWGSCRHGDIQVAVTIEAGKITDARVDRCLTRYSCSWITPIPPRILAKQGTTYDYVSGATESSDAFQDAVAEALSKAKP
jgi:uncharacterized protein with FMN-binding domain